MEKTIVIKNKNNLPLMSWADLKKGYEPNGLKEKKDRDVSGLKESILLLGFFKPFCIWEEGKYIADGAGRFLALEMLEYEGYTIPDLPIEYVDAKDRTEAKQLTVAISSSYGEATKDSLGKFVLDTPEIDLSFANLFGLDMEAIDWNPNKKVDYEVVEDEAPEVQEVPISKLGDIYKLGNHRVICGDATDRKTVLSLMDGDKADLFLTDPPYNVAYTGKTADALTIQNDKMTDANFRLFLNDSFKNADAVMKEGGVFYIWHSDSEGYNFRGACQDAGWKVRECLIWNKNSLVMGRQDYHWKHEPCLYGWKEGHAHLWNSDRKQTTVLEFDRPSRNAEHPTMKPIKLFAYQITNSTLEGGIVFDPFGGSGTALIASEMTGRTCYTMELDPRYIDVIVKRWENLTGRKAEKIG